jgi:hypothetical protein
MKAPGMRCVNTQAGCFQFKNENALPRSPSPHLPISPAQGNGWQTNAALAPYSLASSMTALRSSSSRFRN